MAEHPNVALLRKGYAAFVVGDMQTVGSILADDVVGHAPGNNALSGDYIGKDQVFGYLAKFMALHEGTYRFEIHDLLANDEHGVLMVEEEWEKPKRYRNRSMHIWHLQGERATEFWFFNEDQARVDASFQT
jgi:ketosteroid isomerase-like protein